MLTWGRGDLSCSSTCVTRFCTKSWSDFSDLNFSPKALCSSWKLSILRFNPLFSFSTSEMRFSSFFRSPATSCSAISTVSLSHSTSNAILSTSAISLWTCCCTICNNAASTEGFIQSDGPWQTRKCRSLTTLRFITISTLNYTARNVYHCFH